MIVGILRRRFVQIFPRLAIVSIQSVSRFRTGTIERSNCITIGRCTMTIMLGGATPANSIKRKKNLCEFSVQFERRFAIIGTNTVLSTCSQCECSSIHRIFVLLIVVLRTDFFFYLCNQYRTRKINKQPVKYHQSRKKIKRINSSLY